MRTLIAKERFLQKIATQKKARGTYLFSGRAGTGKKELAQKFIRFLLGDAPGAVTAGVVRVDSLLKKTKTGFKKSQIKTKQVKEALLSMNLAPGTNAYSICLIEEAGRLTVTAQNALLKSLEEPNSRAVYILLVDSEEHLLPTIRSRSVLLRFGSQAKTDTMPVTTNKEWQEELSFLMTNPFYAKVKLIEKIAKDTDDFPSRLDFWVALLTSDMETKALTDRMPKTSTGVLSEERVLINNFLALKEKTRKSEGLSLRLALESIFL